MLLSKNKKAYFDYQILETFQAGLVLSGKLVKEIRQGRVNLSGKYIVYQNQGLEILALGSETQSENVRLLLKSKELQTIQKAMAEKGKTCVPLNLKTAGRWIKSEIAIVKGKKDYQKKETIKQRDLDRELRRGEY